MEGPIPHKEIQGVDPGYAWICQAVFLGEPNIVHRNGANGMSVAPAVV